MKDNIGKRKDKDKRVNKDKNNNYRWLIIGTLIISFLMVIAMTWYFTSQSALVSDAKSMSIAKSIENTLAGNFDINRNDFFWRITMDELIRKAAHFSEYLLLGLITCALFNVLFRRVSWAVVISLVICPTCAYIDEYRQNFFSGRGPSWFDWRVDSSGAVLGIAIAMIVFLILQYIHKLKTQIRELEDRLDN